MLTRALKNLSTALAALIAVVLLGGVTIWWLGRGAYPIQDAVFFALITVATVGYSELPFLSNHPGARMATSILIVAGIATLAFFQSTLTALFIENVIGRIYRRRRMDRRIHALKNHLVLAGLGSTGEYAAAELIAVDEPFVVIDRDPTALEHHAERLKGKLLFVVGDATEDDVLRAAGVERARGVVTALTDDRDNLFVTLSARQMNPRARIVAKVVDVENESKLRRAGADSTVSPNRIGGLRLVSELVRPRVTEFLDQMMRVSKLRFEEVLIPPRSGCLGLSLREVPIREKTNLLVVALHKPDGSFLYNPGPKERLEAGVSLIVIGEADGVRKLKELVART